MAEFTHDSIKPSKDSLKDKKHQITEMFDDVAHKYDFLNRFLSLGIDIQWRKKAIRQLQAVAPKKILDIATGTADVAILNYQLLQPQQVIGIDISEGMLKIGREKIAKAQLTDKIELLLGDGEKLPFPDNSFDAITIMFGIRNFENLEKGLHEMYRVLKPQGKLVILEFSRPKNLLFKPFYHLYMNFITPFVGKLFSKNKDAYQYLNNSIQAFPEREHFTKIMDTAEFKATQYKALSMGICCIYEGSK